MLNQRHRVLEELDSKQKGASLACLDIHAT